MNSNNIINQYKIYHEKTLKGRYINYPNIEPLLKLWGQRFHLEKLGVSENGLPIEMLTVGTGEKKLLLWSQMHGNESTTTKALFDMFHFLADVHNPTAVAILKNCTLYIVPMLNPDGAALYTRVNFNKVDLNRDAQNLTQNESKIFHQLVKRVQPLVAFNLHGQRTIFSAGETNNVATVSFLSPSSNKERAITESRKKGMRIIAEMNKELQKFIPNCVGRYDDGFNINCTGDTLEYQNITTILFEAGHHPLDYDREITRKWMYLSLITSLNYIANNESTTVGYDSYFDIPENGKCFKDIIVRNYSHQGNLVDVSVQFKEILKSNKVIFEPYVSDFQKEIKYFGHLELDALEEKISICTENGDLKIDNKIVSILINNKEFSVFPIIY